MANNPVNLTPSPDPIAEKMRDSVALNKVVQQAVKQAVDRAQRLGFLVDPSKTKL